MALTITVNITSAEQAALENDLLDVNSWVQDAVAGKINACRKRMLVEWVPKLLADPNITALPATEDEIIALILAQPQYMDRAARDAVT